MKIGFAALVAGWLGIASTAMASGSAPVVNVARTETAALDAAFKGNSAARPQIGSEVRLRDAQALIRKLGLDPSRFIATGSGSVGVGGPYVPAAATSQIGDVFQSAAKLEALQSALAAVPAFIPVKTWRDTSGFGTRHDPFNGRAAVHAGLDMAGPQGEPIYASANGTVAKAGRANGYGNLVQLEHGKGIETRYGHLSRILVRPGETVRQGQLIGRMGSTGRSTGTHLHYEIRIDGRPVNPKPFFEASAFVLAAQSEAASRTNRQIGPVLKDNSGPVETILMEPLRLSSLRQDVAL